MQKASACEVFNLQAMPQPLRMHQIKRVIDFHKQGRSIRQIGQLTGISRNTIRDYLRRIASSGRPLEELLAMEDELLLGIVQVDPIEKPDEQPTIGMGPSKGGLNITKLNLTERESLANFSGRNTAAITPTATATRSSANILDDI